MSEGSRDRVYDAYELLPTRALWLRVITSISRDDMQKRMPPGFQLDRARYEPGDEILLTGVSTFFFPFNEIEVLSPESGLCVVGNDHSKVFIEAIGIDQKSGIYVRDLTTGEARLVRGKTSYLVHPGKEVHITRTIPADDWNHWVVVGEPHKQTTRPITSPWALSITVPHNVACMATSASGHRVIEGPCVELLEYEETLNYLTLSTRTPKTDDQVIRTCFLRTIGNRVSDVIRIQTADFVEVDVRVSYSVTFMKEYKDRWFNHENYVQVLCEHTRSLVRSRCRTLQLSQVWPQLTNLIRDVILGDKVEGEGRPGRLFKENGMLVTEVEVLTAEILDPQIAQLYHSVQRQIVSLQIGDREAQAQLASARLRDDVEKERQTLDRAAEQRRAELSDVVRALKQQAALAEAENKAQLSIAAAEAEGAREMAVAKAALRRQEEAQAVERELLARRAEAEAGAKRLLEAQALEAESARHRLQVQLIEAQAAATVAERQAIQRQLVEALTGLGDKLFLAEAAQNMNLVSLFKGKDVMTILGEVLNGTRVAGTVRELQAKHGGEGAS
jgi:major vault protein